VQMCGDKNHAHPLLSSRLNLPYGTCSEAHTKFSLRRYFAVGGFGVCRSYFLGDLPRHFELISHGARCWV